MKKTMQVFGLVGLVICFLGVTGAVWGQASECGTGCTSPGKPPEAGEDDLRFYAECETYQGTIPAPSDLEVIEVVDLWYPECNRCNDNGSGPDPAPQTQSITYSAGASWGATIPYIGTVGANATVTKTETFTAGVAGPCTALRTKFDNYKRRTVRYIPVNFYWVEKWGRYTYTFPITIWVEHARTTTPCGTISYPAYGYRWDLVTTYENITCPPVEPPACPCVPS